MCRIVILFVFLTSFAFAVKGQALSGTTRDDKGEPLPYVTVYVKEAKFGTSSNKDGKYFLTLNEGKYTIIFQCLGYATVEKQFTVLKGLNTLNINLSVKPYLIPTVNVSSSAEDKAYAIMRKAIGMAPYYKNQVQEFTSEVYMKGSVKINKLSWAVKFATRKEKDAPKEGSLYMQESLNNIHFTAPDTYDQNVKMIRSNFPSDDSGGDDAMGFINASLYQPKIGDIILPLAPYAFNYYKFRYAGFAKEGDRIVNKIRVIPKRKSKQLVEGYIYIADNYWNIHSADLTAETMIGTIQVKQTFGEVEKNVWLPVTYNFDIKGKFLGNEGAVNYVSSVKYKSVVVNKKIAAPANLAALNYDEKPEEKKTETKKNKKIKTDAQLKKEQKRKEEIEKLMQKEDINNKDMYKLAKFMDKETKEAADTETIKNLEIKKTHTIKIDSTARISDTAKWNIIRPVELTPEEAKGMIDLQKSLAMKDSTDKKKDTLKKRDTWYETILFGNTWRNEKKKRRISFSGLITPEQFRFNTVDGFVAGIDFYYRKSFENTDISFNPVVAYAFNRNEAMGRLGCRFSYIPLRRGSVSFTFGSESADFNRREGVSALGNTVSSLFFRKNYMKLYEQQYGEIQNQIDLVNGLELITGISYYYRRMLENHTDFSFFFTDQKEYTRNIPVNDSVYGTLLPDHRAVIARLNLNYTPEYYYYMYKNRKRMLSSKYPTFSVDAKFGVPDIALSDVKFIHLEAGIRQNIKMGPNNRLSYRLACGDFLLKDRLYFTDYKHFNTQEIPVVVGDFPNSFQFLAYYKYSANSGYAQGFVTYQSPYLVIKYLPWFSNRMWMENLYLSALYTEKCKPYWEAGYSMNQIGLLCGIGVFVGFDKSKFYMVGVKASINLRGEIRI
ncbi:MAG: carboxypeptidase-like regulatory domain-containing protein [Bacteroidia bacterium]|nr:carboxypeptidase-like regulatory domain-containing protein [Bacteroidia bacterium]